MNATTEKAIETRRLHKEAQKERYRQELREKEAIRKGCVDVLEAKDSTPDQKLEASRILSEIVKR